VQRKKHEAKNHSRSGTRGSGVGKGHGRGGSSSSGSSSKPTGDECRHCGKMGHWVCECRSKPKKEQAHVTQDEDEASLMPNPNSLGGWADRGWWSDCANQGSLTARGVFYRNFTSGIHGRGGDPRGEGVRPP
jgi:hypothetical protein